MNDEHRPAIASTAMTAPFGVLRESLLRVFSSRDIGFRLSVLGAGGAHRLENGYHYRLQWMP
jgi:hypothetical protein